MNAELFAMDSSQDVVLGQRAAVLRGFALPYMREVLSDVETIQIAAPLPLMGNKRINFTFRKAG
jgi:hypothetical protein